MFIMNTPIYASLLGVKVKRSLGCCIFREMSNIIHIYIYIYTYQCAPVHIHAQSNVDPDRQVDMIVKWI